MHYITDTGTVNFSIPLQLNHTHTSTRLYNYSNIEDVMEH